LTPDGVIFCSIDDLNQAYVKTLFDEVFGEAKFLLNVPRITKKGGKSTTTISKNNDYIIAYTLSDKLIFSQEEKTDLDKYELEDEFVEKRGKYKLTQTLDYNSLQWNAGMDYVLEFGGRKFVPGTDVNKFNERHKGKHGITDWVWRWSKSAVEWGIKEKLLVLKNDRIYTKSYLFCRKVNSKNELEYIDPTKSFTTLSYLDNQYSNDNGTKELDKIFENSGSLFKNPKPSKLIQTLITMVNDNKNAIILDFFAGSGTTGQAVLELNRMDGGNRKFILCNINEITSLNPNGIAYDVTSKRLRRIMTGSCYDGFKDYTWLKDNKPYGGSLQVLDLKENSVFDETLIEKIDEELYGVSKINSLKEKIEWVCDNFEKVAKKLKNA
jgi:adenine-specific DNA-methyltransferase